MRQQNSVAQGFKAGIGSQLASLLIAACVVIGLPCLCCIGFKVNTKDTDNPPRSAPPSTVANERKKRSPEAVERDLARYFKIIEEGIAAMWSGGELARTIERLKTQYALGMEAETNDKREYARLILTDVENGKAAIALGFGILGGSMQGGLEKDRANEFTKEYAMKKLADRMAEEQQRFESEMQHIITWAKEHQHAATPTIVELEPEPEPDPVEPFGRLFADNTGEFSVEAKFLEFKRGKVYLRKADGEVIKVPVGKLSTDDQKWVREELKRRREMK